MNLCFSRYFSEKLNIMKNLCQATYFGRVVFLTVCLITVLALFIRVKYVEHTEIYNPIRADARQYVIYGYNIYSHGIFSKELSSKPSPDSFRSPGYPLLISLAFAAGGRNYFYPVSIYSQTIISALLIPLTFLIGKRFLPSSWAVLASVLVALSPHLISMTSYLLTETLFSFILLSAIYSFYCAFEKNSSFFFMLSGFLFGYAYLTNETALFLPFIIVMVSAYFVYRVQFRNLSKKMLLNISLYLIIFSLFPAVWMWRSHNLGPGTSKGSSRAVITMSHGAYPGFVYKNKRFKYFPYREDPMQPVFGSTFRNYTEILFKRFKEKPVRYLSWYLFEKPYYIWSWDNLQSRMGEKCEKGQGDIYVYPVIASLYHIYPSANLSRTLMKFLHPVILIAILTGAAVFINESLRKKNILSLSNHPYIIFITMTYYTLLYTVFAPWPRYSVPLRPEMYLFALWSVKISSKYLKDKVMVVIQTATIRRRKP